MSSASALARLLFHPRAIAVIGASDQPQKIGGRPLLYLQRFGYAGRIFPVNPHRAQVQGIPAFPDLDSLPETPELAVIVTPAAAVRQAIDACVARGVGAAIVMSSGFSETGEPTAIDLERTVVERARAGGLRLVGPNSQGLANFSNGVIASFSTLFMDTRPADGPVAMVSQSGIMSVVPLGLLQRARIGVRYSLASGNEADVSAGELALAALEDPDIRLLLLYLESIRNPAQLALVAARARARGVPVVAVKAGRSSRGQAAAASHTAALASDTRLVDGFFRHHGIWRANDMHELVNVAPLYLRGWRPESRSLVVVSNSGASCVMAADTAADLDLSLATFGADGTDALRRVTPSFASVTNPIDVTAELMHDSAMLGRVLTVLAGMDRSDLVAIDLPVTGEGYDVSLLACDTARFAEQVNQPVAVSTPRPATAEIFRDYGLAVFDNPTDALRALTTLVAHTALMRQADTATMVVSPAAMTLRPSAARRCLHEAASLLRLGERGLPVVSFRVCRDEAEVEAAFRDLGPRVVVKGCSSDVPHKARLGLVSLNVTDADTARTAFRTFGRILQKHGFKNEGVLVQPMLTGTAEIAVGAICDPIFGPVVMIAPGGGAVERAGAVTFLMTPVHRAALSDVLERLHRESPHIHAMADADSDALYRIATGLGQLLAEDPSIISIDANPVLVGTSIGAVIVDALIEQANP